MQTAPSERKLQFSELRYRRLFETAQDGILILNGDTGKIQDVNPFLKKLLGYTEKELIGKELWEIGVFKDIVDSKSAFLELQTKGYIRYKDLPLQTKKGQSIDVEFISNVYNVVDEKVIQCNIRDISDRKAVERLANIKARELETVYKTQEESKRAMLNVMEDLESAKALIELEKVKDDAMLASIGEGLIAVDNERKILILNRAAEDMLGWKMADVVGKEITSFRLENEEGELMSLKQRPTFKAITSGQTVRSTYYFVRKDKTRFPISIVVTPIKLGNKIIGALDVFRDVTHEIEVDKAKSEFVSLASHQLRTPLGIIKWYLEAMGQEDYFIKSPQTVRKYFDEVYKSNERVLSLVRNLLSVSRIEQGRVKNVPVPTDLIKIMIEVVERMQLIAHKKSIELKLRIDCKRQPKIIIDAVRFQEVIENLIVNALEYTKASGVVNVSVGCTEDDYLISVSDTGIGISPSDQKRLFTKFFRSEKAINHNPEGSGLGLYLVKSYVQEWGGKISVSSTEKKGSTFTICLPLKGGDSNEKNTHS